MITPADEPLHDAVRRADFSRPTGDLDPRLCPPAAFGPLVRHEDPHLRHLGLVLLAERVTSGGTGGGPEAAELAELLPVEVDGPPEAALVLARLHERLWPHLPATRRPSWRTAELPARVRIAWLRAELLNEPTVLRHEPPSELLHQAVRDTTATAARRPEHLVGELLATRDPELHAAALRLAREGLHAGLLAPALVREHVIGLLGSGSATVVVAALDELAQPWALSQSLPAGLLSSFLAAEPMAARPEAAAAALVVAAHHGHSDLLWRVIEDAQSPPVLRRRGMELLGDLADRGDIGALTAVAARDPLLFGGPALTCLRGLHRRGHFPDVPHVPSIIDLALADHSIPPQQVATILFTCRQAMCRALVDAAPDDQNWPRRLALLVALAGQGTAELPIGDAITRLLASAPAPEPFLHAIRAVRHTDAEAAVIALLPTSPAAALHALEAIGGHRTVTALREGLGLSAQDGAGVIAPHLRTVRNRALEVLWHLTHEPAQRRALLVRLDPTDLPARVAADLGGPDEQELALLSSHLDPDEPVASLCRLAAHGSAATLPALADLLLRIVTELAASAEPGASEVPRPEHGERAGEPVVPQEILDAVHGLGHRLHDRGRIRPSCLLDAANAREAGHALVATMALDLLDRPGLAGAEQAILCELLLRAPYAGTRARVHHLLRHRDRHVRKHVIALLARDADGHDAQALSASLIALTAARDIQTVRQALCALGHARARWASTAIAACLDHPNMNVRKTAAEVLVRTGTADAVPALLRTLGRHDNPGLRRALVEALRAILGAAYPATVLAAAEQGEGARGRERLLEALEGDLSARSVLALHDQVSPLAPSLLALVADGRLTLASGTVEELSTAMTQHGISRPAAPRTASGRRVDPDIDRLRSEGWDPFVALDIAGRSELPHPTRLWGLRPMLADLLRLAGSEPTNRVGVLRLTLRLCPAPWTPDELAAFTRCVGVLLDALAEAGPADRDGLIAVVEAVAPFLPALDRPAVVEAVRALSVVPGASRSTLPLLRGLGAVLVRADLDRALASARSAADPLRAETAVLRDAFTTARRAADAGPTTADAEADAAAASRTRAWHAALAVAARTPAGLEEFRGSGRPREQDDVPGSGDRLTALIDMHGSAGPETRAALIDWMTALQPLDAPPWTITETVHAPAPRPRTVHIDDLDQPRSTALRERLLAMLRAPAPDRRSAAASALLDWPEPEAGRAVLRAFLRGDIDVPVGADLARTLHSIDETELRADGILHDRVALAAGRLDPEHLEPLVPLLLEWWESDPPAGSAAAGLALRRVPADALAERLRARIDAGARGHLDLLVGRPLLRTPALTRTCLRLRAEGRDELADGLLLVDGPLRPPDCARQDLATSAALRDRGAAGAMSTGRPQPPSRQELLALARTGDPVRIRRALTRLAEEHSGPDADQDPELRDLIGELLRHPKPGVRIRAHRTSRALLDRPTHLHHTSILLDDPQPDLVRTAIRALCHARWVPAIPTVTRLLEHAHPLVRKAAADGLVAMGGPAVPALRHAVVHVRPDKRPRYARVLDRITTAGDQTPGAMS
ncbi:HEAT repeat domain-containing protein [Streptomyces sp. NPDC001568]|uniref:HEAT repeat domain-containing protein n=1 Tax=Streptomyces sp. NPDC001568 TaxID=3364588 RepID=UPI00367F4EBF